MVFKDLQSLILTVAQAIKEQKVTLIKNGKQINKLIYLPKKSK